MNPRHKPSPSFSSSLLDEIYRSIDGVEGMESKEENVMYHQKKMSERKEEKLTFHQKMNEKRVEKQTYHRKMNEKKDERVTRNLSSSSSDSEWGFSSSESRSSGFSTHRPKPIRTGLPIQNQTFEEQVKVKKKESESGFDKTKAKVMKIYGDLKKVKQPMSPSGRLATFLNSVFNVSSPKKTKVPSSTLASYNETLSRNTPKSSSTSTCSSASSFSRSCLSNPSLREKTSNGAKRSVRFYPVNVVLGEDNRPQYKSKTTSTIKEELKLHIIEKNRRVDEAARDLLKDYQKAECEYRNAQNTRMNSSRQNVAKVNHVDDEDDDAASYASSDLFELDHLSAFEELPVYETTHLRTNLAIAKGLIS